MEKHYLPIVALLLLMLRPVGKPAAHIPFSHELTSRRIWLDGGDALFSLVFFFFFFSTSKLALCTHRICGGLDAHNHSQGCYIIARGRTYTQHAHTHTHNTRTHTRSWFAPGCSFTWFASHGSGFQSQPNTATIITARERENNMINL